MSKRFTYYGGIQGGLLPYLTAYWTADNIATDVYVNNLGGAWNATSHYATGINGQAFDFQNNNTIRYVDVPDNDLLSFTDGTNDVPFTLNFWVNPHSLSSTGDGYVMQKGTFDIGEREYFIILRTTGIFFNKLSLNTNTNTVLTRSLSGILNTTQWQMVTITSDGSKFGEKIYLNSIDVTNTSTENGTFVKMQNGNSSLFLNARTNNRKYKGMLDEFAIFNGTELTQLQVQDLYNGGVGKFYPNI